jgi:hypothetical protein
LGIAVVLDFGQSSLALVDGMLVLLTKIMLLSDAFSKVFFFTLKLLVI